MLVQKVKETIRLMSDGVNIQKERLVAATNILKWLVVLVFRKEYIPVHNPFLLKEVLEKEKMNPLNEHELEVVYHILEKESKFK